VTPEGFSPCPESRAPALILFVLPEDSDSSGKAQLPNPLLQKLPLRFLLGQRQCFLIRAPGLRGPSQTAAHIGTRVPARTRRQIDGILFVRSGCRRAPRATALVFAFLAVIPAGDLLLSLLVLLPLLFCLSSPQGICFGTPLPAPHNRACPKSRPEQESKGPRNIGPLVTNGLPQRMHRRFFTLREPESVQLGFSSAKDVLRD
jgi:hypothetical protein